MVLKQIIIKNLKIILRNPFVLLFLIVIPILFMLIIGYAYQANSLNNVDIGVINDQQNILYEIDGVSFNNYNSTNKTQNLDNCIKNLRASKEDLCIKFDFAYDKNDTLKNLLVSYYVDNSRIQLSYILIRNINVIIEGKTQEVLKGQITSVMDEIKGIVEEAEAQKEDIENLKLELKDTTKEMEDLKKKLSSSKTKLQLLKVQINERNIVFKSKINKIGDKLDEVSNIGLIGEFIDLAGFEEDLNNLGNDDINYLNVEIDNNIKEIESFEIFIDNTITKLNNRGENIVLLEQQYFKKIDYFKQISKANPDELTNPVRKKETYILPDLERIHQLSPIIVILLLLFIGLLLSNTICIIDINSNAQFKNILSPIKDYYFLIGQFLTSYFLILFQIVFLLIIMEWEFNLGISQNWFPIFILITHICAIFIIAGMLFAYLFKSEQISILFSTFFMLFLFLLSHIIFPIQLMPDLVYYFVAINPIVVGEGLLRQILFFDEFRLGIIDMWSFYLLIGIFGYLLFLAQKRRLKMY